MANINDNNKLNLLDVKTGIEQEFDPAVIVDVIPMRDEIGISTILKTTDPREPLKQVREAPSDVIILLVKCAETVAAIVIERLLARALR